MNDYRVGRPIKVEGMACAPTNEQGVVFLFGRLAPKLGFQIEHVRTGFPDCIAVRRGRKVRIEFEFRASNYKCHPANGADIIVCWENDWEQRPRQFCGLEIIDLKPHVHAAPRIFTVGCNARVRGDTLDRYKRHMWSVPKVSNVGDLILMYRTIPDSHIRDLWEIVGPFEETDWGHEAQMRNVERLGRPIEFIDFKKNRLTRGLGVVVRRFQGKTDITDYWHLFYDMIIDRNPKAKKALEPWCGW
jgi:hypothetical protein